MIPGEMFIKDGDKIVFSSPFPLEGGRAGVGGGGGEAVGLV
mgnify:CR=1 FL=1